MIDFKLYLNYALLYHLDIAIINLIHLIIIILYHLIKLGNCKFPFTHYSFFHIKYLSQLRYLTYYLCSIIFQIIFLRPNSNSHFNFNSLFFQMNLPTNLNYPFIKLEIINGIYCHLKLL